MIATSRAFPRVCSQRLQLNLLSLPQMLNRRARRLPRDQRSLEVVRYGSLLHLVKLNLELPTSISLHAHCMQQDVAVLERSAETIVLVSLVLMLHEKRTRISRRPRVRGVTSPTKARARARTMERARARMAASSPREQQLQLLRKRQ